ncbi:MAG: hypothetical protein ACE5RI_07840 [Candidatus Nitrosomaritimum yanchengensis]
MFKTKTHITDKIIAISPLVTELKKESNSPKPVIEMGPRIVTAMPPPTKIKTHIKNMNPKSCPWIIF